MPVFLLGDRFSGTLNFGLCSLCESANRSFSGADGWTSATDSFPLLHRAGRMDFLGEADRRAVEISIRCPVERLRDRSCLGVQGGVSRGVRSVGVAEPGVADPDAGSVRGDLASGVADPWVSETFGRGVGFGRCILSNSWARGLIGSLGVPSPERGVVDVGWLLTGILVIGGVPGLVDNLGSLHRAERFAVPNSTALRQFGWTRGTRADLVNLNLSVRRPFPAFPAWVIVGHAFAPLFQALDGSWGLIDQTETAFDAYTASIDLDRRVGSGSPSTGSRSRTRKGFY